MKIRQCKFARLQQPKQRINLNVVGAEDTTMEGAMIPKNTFGPRVLGPPCFQLKNRANLATLPILRILFVFCFTEPRTRPVGARPSSELIKK